MIRYLVVAAAVMAQASTSPRVTFTDVTAGAGIHFQHAVQDGHRQGRSIGRAVGKLLPPVRKWPDNY